MFAHCFEQRRLLRIVVALHVVDDGTLKALIFAGLAGALLNRRAEAVGARNEEHILFANAVAKEARIGVGGHEHAADVAEATGWLKPATDEDDAGVESGFYTTSV